MICNYGDSSIHRQSKQQSKDQERNMGNDVAKFNEVIDEVAITMTAKEHSLSREEAIIVWKKTKSVSDGIIDSVGGADNIGKWDLQRIRGVAGQEIDGVKKTREKTDEGEIIKIKVKRGKKARKPKK